MDIPRQDQLDSASQGLRIIAHPIRLQILCHLLEGPMNVSELIEQIKVSQPVLSQHLAKLRLLNVLNCERQGKQVFYRLADPAYSTIIAAVRTVYCQEANLPNKGTAL
jgi:ArsR family transcriptional regulator